MPTKKKIAPGKSPSFLKSDDTLSREMIRSAESGKWHLVSDPETLALYTGIAQQTPRKRKTITVKVPDTTLRKFRIKAEREHIPYQTLLSSVMQKYADGKLVEHL